MHDYLAAYVSRFTSVNVFYSYCQVKEQEPIKSHCVKVPGFTTHWSTQVFLHIWAHVSHNLFGFVNVSSLLHFTHK